MADHYVTASDPMGAIKPGIFLPADFWAKIEI
jgi:hypothetical protein